MGDATSEVVCFGCHHLVLNQDTMAMKTYRKQFDLDWKEEYITPTCSIFTPKTNDKVRLVFIWQRLLVCLIFMCRTVYNIGYFRYEEHNEQIENS